MILGAGTWRLIENSDEELGNKLIQMAGYRNRLVHLYNLIEDEELYEIISSGLKDIEAFVSAIKRHLLKI